MATIFLGRIVDHGEAWEFTDGIGWCQMLLDVLIMRILKIKNSKLQLHIVFIFLTQ